MTARWLIVFEHVIARVPESSAKVAEFYRVTRSWRRMVDCFEADELVCKRLWDMTWRKNIRFDVVTFMPHKAEQHVVRWLDRQGLPFGRLLQYDDPDRLVRALVSMPDVWVVVHADASRPLVYGPRGRLVGGEWS